MSPFLTYLLFQADSISEALGFIAILAGMLFCVAVPLKWVAQEGRNEHESAAIAYKACRVAIWICPIIVAAGILMPSSKTIAAMIVLPKITSPQALDTMGKESRDIYELAKKALANLADDKPSRADPKH